MFLCHCQQANGYILLPRIFYFVRGVIVVVVSPLTALMKDQVSSIPKRVFQLLSYRIRNQIKKLFLQVLNLCLCQWNERIRCHQRCIEII